VTPKGNGISTARWLETKVDGITGSLAEIKTLVSRRLDGRP
jgi:hypothetical protein